MNTTFCKEERLCSKVLIDELFDKQGDKIKFTEFPFIIIAKKRQIPTDYPAQMLVSVSKRKLRHAVKRNLVKRRVKEAYRLNKAPLYDYLKSKDEKLIVSFIYVANKPLPYQLIEEKIIVLLNRLINE
jgi:ribonuclease P protein component